MWQEPSLAARCVVSVLVVLGLLLVVRAVV